MMALRPVSSSWQKTTCSWCPPNGETLSETAGGSYGRSVTVVLSLRGGEQAVVVPVHRAPRGGAASLRLYLLRGLSAAGSAGQRGVHAPKEWPGDRGDHTRRGRHPELSESAGDAGDS